MKFCFKYLCPPSNHQAISSVPTQLTAKEQKKISCKTGDFWAHMDLNQGPLDYESRALTN